MWVEHYGAPVKTEEGEKGKRVNCVCVELVWSWGRSRDPRAVSQCLSGACARWCCALTSFL